MRKLVLIVLACMFFVTGSAAGADISDELKREFENHLMGVRYPIHEGEQHFDSAGHPLETTSEQWEVYGGILVQKVSLSQNRLRIAGPRMAIGDQANGKWQVGQISKPVTFDIQLDHPLTSLDDANAVLGRIFYLDENDRDHMKPAYLRHGSSPSPDAALDETKSRRTDVIYPKPVYTPEPDFSEEARKAHFQGEVGLKIIVDRTGAVSWVRVESALGRGLDENAVEAVKKWRFRPATRDGEAVSVRLKVEVDYHLYSRR